MSRVDGERRSGMSSKKKHWSAILDVLDACRAGRKYAAKFKSLQDLWDACERPAWMAWLCSTFGWDEEFGFQCTQGMDKASATASRFWREADGLSVHVCTFYDPCSHDGRSGYITTGSGFRNKRLADLIRKYWPKPPRIPKKLLKEAGLV